MKREKVENSSRAVIMAASTFSKDAAKDTKINSQRSIDMINNRNNRMSGLK